MRPIKFRGWHFGLGKMFSAEQMGSDQLTILPSTGQFINVSSVSPTLSQIVPLDVMLPLQFTGCVDQEGTEIYEGDLVGFFRPDVGYLVEFKYGGFGMQTDSNNWLQLGGNTQFFALVLGNVYQNPELVES